MIKQRINKGKVVYWVNGQRFENSQGKRDGRTRAEEYCLNNFVNTNDIQKFDSRTECNRYEFLLSQQREGKIDNLGHHFTLKIQDEYINANGDTIPAITYEADFIYRDLVANKRVVEDVKGSEFFIDERFITIKQVFDKLMLDKGLYIKIILYRGGEWVEWHIGEAKKRSKLIKKQREEIKELRKKEHERQMHDNLVARETARYKVLKEKEKLSSSERKRFEELRVKYGGYE